MSDWYLNVTTTVSVGDYLEKKKFRSQSAEYMMMMMKSWEAPPKDVYMRKHTIPVGTPAKSIRSMLSMRLWIDFKIKFNAETLLRMAEILAACCMMNGNGASSKSLSSSATSKIVEGQLNWAYRSLHDDDDDCF